MQNKKYTDKNVSASEIDNCCVEFEAILIYFTLYEEVSVDETEFNSCIKRIKVLTGNYCVK
jgi:hypothetical protein